jgi:hypothetical protein
MSDSTPFPDPAHRDPSRPQGAPPLSGTTTQPQSQPGPQFAPSALSPYAAGAPGAYPSSPVPEPAVERVGRGLALALVAIPAAMVLTAAIWRLGFIASISAFALSALAVILYRRGSGGVVRRGIPGLLALIVVGAVACFFSAVATDLFLYYGTQSAAEQAGLGTPGEFLSANLFYGPVLSTYGKDAALFGLFTVLGVFGTFRRLLRRGPSV